MRIPRRVRKKARIEIVPMIDIMLFLLIFFMMASLAMTTMTGVKVSLPRAASGEKTTAARILLTMTDRNEIFLNRQSVTLPQVTPLLKQQIMANPETVVIINADERLRHGQVIALMDAAKLADPKYLQIATQPNTNFRQ